LTDDEVERLRSLLVRAYEPAKPNPFRRAVLHLKSKLSRRVSQAQPLEKKQPENKPAA
jgi:hypothetical protein